MNCPICQQAEISENIKTCPKCSSDLSYLNEIKQVSRRIKNRNIFFISVFLILIILVFFTFFTFCNFSNSENKDNKKIEQLKNENEVLQNTIKELNTQLKDLNKMDVKEDSLIKETTDSEVVEYIVQKDENLWIIAQKFYGDGHQFRKIALDNNLKRPYQIFIGTKLIIKK